MQKMTNRTKITQKSSKKHSIDTISKRKRQILRLPLNLTPLL